MMKPPDKTRSVPIRSASGPLRSASPSLDAGQHLIDEHHRQISQCRYASQRHGRIMPLVGGGETLGRDFQPDENQDRKHGRQRQDGVQRRKIANDSGRADDQGRRQRVARASSHGLVGRMADERSRLNHPTAKSRHERCHRFDGNHTARVKLIAGGRGALGAVDATDDRRQREGDHKRQISDRIARGAQPAELPYAEPLSRKPGIAHRADAAAAACAAVSNGNGPAAQWIR